MKKYDLHSLNVLVIDDNDYMRVLLKRVLVSLGVARVGEARNGEDAYKQLRTSAPDIIFCDREMAPLNGLEFVRQLRSAPDSPCPMVPVVMVSSYTELQYVEEARDVGANGYLAKPISPKLLYERICRIIESPGSFIRSKTYKGPDRRHVTSAQYSGEDRRVIEPVLRATKEATNVAYA